MRKIYKICLIIALFIASSGIALAGFNYDSANNYFLLDSVLNLSGGNDNYVLVGNGLIGLKNSLSVSNNLIFLNRGASGGELKDTAARTVNKSNFSTPAINLNTTDPDINLVISTIGGSGILTFRGFQIMMNQNFMIPNGLGIYLAEGSAISPRTIYVEKVLANNLESLITGQDILIPSATLLKAAPTSIATAAEITFDGNPFCEVKKWNAAENSANGTVLSFMSADVGGGQTDCDENYYVFNMNATIGIMVCCRYASKLVSY